MTRGSAEKGNFLDSGSSEFGDKISPDCCCCCCAAVGVFVVAVVGIAAGEGQRLKELLELLLFLDFSFKNSFYVSMCQSFYLYQSIYNLLPQTCGPVSVFLVMPLLNCFI